MDTPTNDQYTRVFFHEGAKASIQALIPKYVPVWEFSRKEYDDEGNVKGHVRMTSYTQGSGPAYQTVALHEWSRDPSTSGFQLESVSVFVEENMEQFYADQDTTTALFSAIVRVSDVQWTPLA